MLVQGPLQSALLARALTDWIGGARQAGPLLGAEPRVAYPGQALTFGGAVTAKRVDDGIGLVDLDIAGRRDDTVLMPGTATVALPLRAGAR